MLHTSLDAIALLEHTANKLSVARRTNIRPALSEEYRGLCKLEFTGSDYLFGQDLAKSMAQTREMNNISTNVFKKPSTFYQQRFQLITNVKNSDKRLTKRELILFCGKITDTRMDHQEKRKQDAN